MINSKFTVIVPVYKVNELYLRLCINSILCQTYTDFELILVDDGSPDNCGTICDVYSASDARVRVIHQDNQGVSAARNSGIKHATGEWILFVDADDWIERDMLERLTEQSAGKECDIILFHGIREYDDKSVEIAYNLQPNHIYNLNVFKDKEFLYDKIIQVPNEKGEKPCRIYYSWDKAYRRTFLIENRLEYTVGLSKSEDKVFIACCFEKARYILHIENALYHYRCNEDSICQRYSSNMDKQRLLLAEKLSVITARMNTELAMLSSVSNYSKIKDAYERYLFGITSDVLLLQYYHKDNPQKKTRRKDAIGFIGTEPFKSAIKNVPYSSLGLSGKMKKFMLEHKVISLFCYIKKMKKSGNRAQTGL